MFKRTDSTQGAAHAVRRVGASCGLSWALPNLSRLQAQAIYDRLSEWLDCLYGFIGGFDEVRNRSLSAPRVGQGYVVQLSLRRAAAKALDGDPYDLAARLQCFIGHAWKMAVFAMAFNPESRCLSFKLTHYRI